MAKKKDAKNENEKYDQHIIDALLKMKMPIIGIYGRKYYLREKVHDETGIEHIAIKRHRLKVRDIESIPAILMKPKYVCEDPKHPIYRNYYGIRKGEDKNTLLKIVTSPVKGKRDKEEVIVTIYPVSRIKID